MPTFEAILRQRKKYPPHSLSIQTSESLDWTARKSVPCAFAWQNKYSLSRRGINMSELIYILTVIFTAYVVYTAEGDQIVAFIKGTFNIDLTHPHECCTHALNRIKKAIDFKSFGFKWPTPV
jgi:hypothetical protein